MAEIIELSAPDLAAMLCSRVCHDLINPVGAMGNGLQALEDPEQASMKDLAKELVANASKMALARLEFARLAYGASSTAGTEFDTGECERVAQLLFEVEKADLDWKIAPVMVPKNKGKLLMNMLIIASGTVPRGGKVSVSFVGEAGKESIEIVTTSEPGTKQKTLIPSGVKELMAGNPENGVDARGIQPFYTGLLARLSNMELGMDLEGATLKFSATQK